MSATPALLVLLGLVHAAGLWLVLTGARVTGRPSFATRIAPQLRSVEVESALLARPGRRSPARDDVPRRRGIRPRLTPCSTEPERKH